MASHTLTLSVLSFQNHYAENIWTEGDPDPELDFGIHILKTTKDHNINLPMFLSLLFF